MMQHAGLALPVWDMPGLMLQQGCSSSGKARSLAMGACQRQDCCAPVHTSSRHCCARGAEDAFEGHAGLNVESLPVHRVISTRGWLQVASNQTRPIQAGGALMLGSDQDCFGGCPDAYQSFFGLMDEVSFGMLPVLQVWVPRFAEACLQRLAFSMSMVSPGSSVETHDPRRMW